MKCRTTFLLFLLPLVTAASLRYMEAGRNGVAGPYLKNGEAFCPAWDSGFSILCDLKGAGEVQFKMNDAWIRTEQRPPYYIMGDFRGLIFPWSRFPWGIIKIGCYGDNHQSVEATVRIGCMKRAPTNEPSRRRTRTVPPPPPPMPTKVKSKVVPPKAQSRSAAATKSTNVKKVSSSYCVTKKATDYIGSKHSDWVKDSSGALTYRPDDHDEHKTVGHTTAKLKYRFKVPVESTYGVVVDMTTRDYTEFNDVFVSCVGGLTLRKGRKIVSVSKPVKAYHNKKGRAKISSSVDFNPHAISTRLVLVPGREYECSVHARSTRTTVHGLILFPCFEDQCNENSKHWLNYLRICHV